MACHLADWVTEENVFSDHSPWGAALCRGPRAEERRLCQQPRGGLRGRISEPVSLQPLRPGRHLHHDFMKRP